MSIIKPKVRETVFKVIVGNRDVFPDNLAEEGRKEIISVLEDLGYKYIILNEIDAKFGVVETYEDTKKCAELFKNHRDSIIGIVVVMPNFSDDNFIFV